MFGEHCNHRIKRSPLPRIGIIQLVSLRKQQQQQQHEGAGRGPSKLRSLGHLSVLGLEKEPSCLVLTSLSCSSCLWARRNRYSMCMTSFFLIREFSLNSSRMRGMKPGLSRPAWRNWRYKARTCCCILLCRDMSGSLWLSVSQQNKLITMTTKITHHLAYYKRTETQS